MYHCTSTYVLVQSPYCCRDLVQLGYIVEEIDSSNELFSLSVAIAMLNCYVFALIFQNQVRDLKEMCEFLKKEKAEVERKLGHVRGVSV